MFVCGIEGSEKPKSDSKVGKKLEKSETQEEIVNHKCNSASKGTLENLTSRFYT